jgi:hypothetical protein
MLLGTLHACEAMAWGDRSDQRGAPTRPCCPPTRSPAGPPAAAPVRTSTFDDQEVIPLPGSDETVSFAADVRPLFREHDRESMMRAFDLWSYDDVRAHSAAILGKLSQGTMPCDGAWPAAKVEVFRRWTETGFQP